MAAESSGVRCVGALPTDQTSLASRSTLGSAGSIESGPASGPALADHAARLASLARSSAAARCAVARFAAASASCLAVHGAAGPADGSSGSGGSGTR